MLWSGSPMTKSERPPWLQRSTSSRWIGLTSWNSSTSRLRKAASRRSRPSRSTSSRSRAPRACSAASYSSRRPSGRSWPGRPFFCAEMRRWHSAAEMPASPRAARSSARTFTASARPTSCLAGRCCRHTAWKVPTVSPRSACFPPSSASRRSRSSCAAWRVKVTAVISLGGTPSCAIMCAMRATSVRVLPVPGPATTATAGSCARTASACRSLSPATGATGATGAAGATGATGATCAAFCAAAGAVRRRCGAPSPRPKSAVCPARSSNSCGAKSVMRPYSPS